MKVRDTTPSGVTPSSEASGTSRGGGCRVPGVPAETGAGPAALGHGADIILRTVPARSRRRWWHLARNWNWNSGWGDGLWRGWHQIGLFHRYSNRCAEAAAPWRVTRYVVAVEAGALGAAGTTVAVAVARGPDLAVEQFVTFGAFVVLAVTALFAFRCGATLARPAEHPYSDALSPWTLSVALLLPPTYAAVMHLPLLLAGGLRLRPRRRNVFDAAVLTLAGLAAASVHRAFTPAEGSYQIETLVGSAGQVAALFGAVAVFAATSRVLHAGLRRTLGRNAEHRQLLGGREAAVVDTAETCSAIVVAVLWTAHPLLLFATTPPALLLQRNLHHTELLHAARTDTKTGLANPAYWRGVAERELLRTTRAGRPTSVLLVDVDHFKLVNDNHGHLVGDAVLSCVADALRAATQPRELVGRFGGEEFVVLLADTDVATAAEVAEQIRRQVAAARCRTDGRPPVAVTVSVGVACAAARASDTRDGAGADAGETLDSLLERADNALYAAKTAGRNRVRTAAP